MLLISAHHISTAWFKSVCKIYHFIGLSCVEVTENMYLPQPTIAQYSY